MTQCRFAGNISTFRLPVVGGRGDAPSSPVVVGSGACGDRNSIAPPSGRIRGVDIIVPDQKARYGRAGIVGAARIDVDPAVAIQLSL